MTKAAWFNHKALHTGHGSIPAFTWTSRWGVTLSAETLHPQEQWCGVIQARESLIPLMYVTSARVSKTWWWNDENMRQQRGRPPPKTKARKIKIIYTHTYKHRSNKARSRLVWTSIRPTDTMTWQRLAAVLVSLYITSLTRKVRCCTGNSAILV